MRYLFEQKHDVLEYEEAGSEFTGEGVILTHYIRDVDHGDIERGEIFLNKDELIKMRELIDNTLKKIK